MSGGQAIAAQLYVRHECGRDVQIGARERRKLAGKDVAYTHCGQELDQHHELHGLEIPGEEIRASILWHVRQILGRQTMEWILWASHLDATLSDVEFECSKEAVQYLNHLCSATVSLRDIRGRLAVKQARQLQKRR